MFYVSNTNNIPCVIQSSNGVICSGLCLLALMTTSSPLWLTLHLCQVSELCRVERVCLHLQAAHSVCVYARACVLACVCVCVCVRMYISLCGRSSSFAAAA